MVLRYEVTTLPLQGEVGHVRQWSTHVYQNGMVQRQNCDMHHHGNDDIALQASWGRMKETSVLSKNKLSG